MTRTNLAPEEGTLADLARQALAESDETARAYLRQWWLSSAMEELVKARRAQGLSQRQVAERLGTTQSAIARLERDDEGAITLHRYVDYALACGMLPFDLDLVPFERMRAYALFNPNERRTAVRYTVLAGDVARATNILPQAVGSAYQEMGVQRSARQLQPGAFVHLATAYDAPGGAAEGSGRETARPVGAQVVSA